MDRFFGFREHGTNMKQESVAGLTTFLAMAYILFVNPYFLSAAGMDADAVFVATGLSAAIGSLVMGLWAKYPIALAPGMGLNAFFAFTVVLGMGIPWQTALAGVLVSGIIMFVITISKIRETIINAIPTQLKLAAGAGIGLFIAFIGLQNAQIIIADEATIVGLGELGRPTTLLAIFGTIVTAMFMIRGYKGGIFYGMVLTAIAGVVTGLIGTPEQIVKAIPSLAPTFGQALIHFNEIFTVEIWIVIFTFLFV